MVRILSMITTFIVCRHCRGRLSDHLRPSIHLSVCLSVLLLTLEGALFIHQRRHFDNQIYDKDITEEAAIYLVALIQKQL